LDVGHPLKLSLCYFADDAPGHPDDPIKKLLSVGNWLDGGTMNKKLVVALTGVAVLILGGAIIGISVYQKNAEPATLQSFTDENFEKKVLEVSKDRPVLVDVYAEWCLPCRFLEPALIQLAKELGDRAAIGKVDLDKNLIARRLGVQKVPTILIIRDGQIMKRFLGAQPKKTLMKALKEQGA
jgi:thioredoxin